MKTKTKILITILVFVAIQTKAQRATITGDIKGLKVSELVFSYAVADSSKRDTVKVKGGKFVWKKKLVNPKKIYILFPNRNFEFFAENSRISITGSADSIAKLKITGSKTQNEADTFFASLKDIEDQQYSLALQYEKASKEERLAIEEEIADLRTKQRARTNAYIAEHPDSYFSVNLVKDRSITGSYRDVKEAFDLLSTSAQNSEIGRWVNKRLKVLKRGSIGETVINFSQKDTEGKVVHFADFRGKYVLIDFWASWCGPCRAENPNVLKAYNKYKEKNFTVLGVSLDDNGDNWKKAIQDDGMPWTQVSDLKGWENEVSSYYGIRGIPSSLLVDPEGKIIAKNLRGEALNKKLAELFK